MTNFFSIRFMARLAGRRCLRCMPAVSLWLLLQTAAAGAFAHASLIDVAPADGAMLRSVPAAITLHFNESVAPLVFKLLLPNGTALPLTHISTVPNGLQLDLSTLSGADAPNGNGIGNTGTYLLSWRVISADGHPVGGSVTYSVGVRSGATAAELAALSSSASSPTLVAAIWTVRLGLYIALFTGIGAALFRAFIALPTPATPSMRWPMFPLLAGLVLLLLAVGLQGLDALALPWQALGSWQAWHAGLDNAYGVTIGLMLAALLAANFSFASLGIASRLTATAAILLLGAALAASGHASSAPPFWLARPAVFAHGIAIVAWAGSLLPLLLILRDHDAGQASEPNVAVTVLLRFSRVIPWVLALLLISGGTLIYLQLDSVHSLWTSDYGRILSAKLILVVLLLCVAAVNRYAFTERVLQGEATARRRMRRLIGVELGLVLLILALATTWRFTPPPRALNAAHPIPISVHMHGEKAMIDLTLNALADHRLRASLFVQGGDFSPLNAQEVSLQFSNPAQGIEPLQKEAHRGADNGSWVVEPFSLPAPGRWHVRVEVLISDFENTALEQDVDLAF